MRFKVPFLRFALAVFAFLLPTAVLAAILPFLVNAAPIRAKLMREIGSWSGGEARIAGAVSIQDFFSLSVEARDVEIGQLRRVPAVEALKAERVVARIAWTDLLLGNIEFDKIKIHGALFKIRAGGIDDLRRLYADLVSGPKDKPFAALQLSDSLIAIRPAARRPFRRLRVEGAVARGVKGGRFLSGSARVAWKGEVASLSMRSAFHVPADRRGAMRVQIASAPLTVRFDGEAGLGDVPDLSGELAMQAPNLAEAARWAGFALDEGTLETPAAIAGPFTLIGDGMSITSRSITLAGQTAQAALTFKPAGDVPRLEGSLAFERVDLKALLAGIGGENLGQGLLQRQPLGIDLRVSASAAAWDGLEVGETAIALTGDAPRRMNLEIAQVNLLGGEVRGQIGLEQAGPFTRASARLTGETLDAAAVLRLTGQREWLAGAADVNVEAEAVWTDPAAIMEGLTAKARVHFPEGGQLSLDIPRLAATAPGEHDGWGSFAFDGAAFDALRFEATLREGRIAFSEVLLASNGRGVSGGGEIDLASQSMDWQLLLAPESDADRDGQAAATPSATGPRLSIRGPWTRPVIRSGEVSGNSMLTRPRKEAVALEISPAER